MRAVARVGAKADRKGGPVRRVRFGATTWPENALGTWEGWAGPTTHVRDVPPGSSPRDFPDDRTARYVPTPQTPGAPRGHLLRQIWEFHADSGSVPMHNPRTASSLRQQHPQPAHPPIFFGRVRGPGETSTPAIRRPDGRAGSVCIGAGPVSVSPNRLGGTRAVNVLA